MIVDPLTTRWVKLHHGIVGVPKETDDVAHFIPGRATSGQTDADVFEVETVRGNHLQGDRVRLVANEECSVVAVFFRAGHRASRDAKPFWDVERHGISSIALKYRSRSSVRFFIISSRMTGASTWAIIIARAASGREPIVVLFS